MRSTVKFADLVALSKHDRADALQSLFPFGGLMERDGRHMRDADRNKLIRAAFKEAEKAGTIPQSVKVSVRSPHAGSVTVEIQAVPFLIPNPENVRWQEDNPHSVPAYDAPFEAKEWRTDAAQALRDILETIASQWRYDKSDSMTDYFDTNYYLHIRFSLELERAHKEWILSVPRSVTIKPKGIMGKPARVANRRTEVRAEALEEAHAEVCTEVRATVNGPAVVEASAPEVTTGAAALRIESYSEKSIIVKGETLAHKDRIKSAVSGLAPFWHRQAVGWIFPTSRESEARASLADLLCGFDTPPAGPDDGPGNGKPESDGHNSAEESTNAAPPPEVFGNQSKLFAIADRIEARAQGILSRDRLTNTPRRVSIAASVEADAQSQITLARTLRAIGEAQKDGTAGLLAKLSTAKQAELFRSLIRRARYKADSGLSYSEQLDRKGRKASEADLIHIDFPKDDDGHRLRAMGILTTGQLRQAAARFVELSSEAPKADPIKAALRDLVGRKIPGFFRTPADLARRVVDLLDLQPGHSVLEPSAGAGDIADAMAETVGRDGVTVLEINGTLCGLLQAKGYTVAGRDFFDHVGLYDRIGMNPPFEGLADTDHVRRAFGMLKPGGRLVAIMAESPFFRSDRKAEEFRTWLDGVGGTSERLPAGSFQESGTGVATRIVVIDA
ncbi:hypothetical protein [Azospirillum brasilense]|uniref:hypothetical protein n=1 Tax=Azospirillum brasilense TaxID=192 RepID=UPI000E69CC84|nr:hypothetical protein [Azospirillum brasilense]NUB25746.1 hypothetical protein [Azospirillum brasilense]NUB33884.1 hypothetical protein [Azospirillum brasilense]RIW07742.1 hypothetical protein D2T81_02575 [Azospirillum brasilense]